MFNYEITNEFIVPKIGGAIELLSALPEFSGTHAVKFFGWVKNSISGSVYPANKMSVLIIGDEKYLIPIDLLNNIVDRLSKGDTKNNKNFEFGNWKGLHLNMKSETKYEVPDIPNAIGFCSKVSDMLETSGDYIIPGSGLTKFIHDGQTIMAKGVNVHKIVSGGYGVYIFEKDDNVVDLAEISSSDSLDTLALSNMASYTVNIDLDVVEESLKPYARGIDGMVVPIKEGATSEVNSLIKALSSGKITLGQLNKLATIVGKSYVIIPEEEHAEPIFFKLPNTKHTYSVFQTLPKKYNNTALATLHYGVFFSGEHRAKIKDIENRVKADSLTAKDLMYLCDNR